MAFVRKSPQPYACLRRGQKEMDMLYLYDKPQFKQSNGIYAEITESDLTSLQVMLDGKVQSYRLSDGIVKKDDEFIPQSDSAINDASGKVLTVVFENSKSASIYVPMILSNKIDDLVTKFGGFAWKDMDGTALVVSRIDYKTSKSFITPTP